VFHIFPIFFLGMLGWVVSSIVLGVRANAGHWSALPGFGRLTVKLLGPDQRVMAPPANL
jgi:enoyl reductase-like protein